MGNCFKSLYVIYWVNQIYLTFKSYSLCLQLTQEEKKKFEDCERKLDLTNIVIIRQRIQLESERLERRVASTEQKSWLGWFWGSSSKVELEELKKTTAIRELSLF